jgi:hypothetical protein
MGNNNLMGLRRSRQYLTEDIFHPLKSIQVELEMPKKTEYYVLNIQILQPRYLIPAAPHRLLNRGEGYRKLLAETVDIRWNSKFRNITRNQNGAKATLEMGQNQKRT